MLINIGPCWEVSRFNIFPAIEHTSANTNTTLDWHERVNVFVYISLYVLLSRCWGCYKIIQSYTWSKIHNYLKKANKSWYRKKQQQNQNNNNNNNNEKKKKTSSTRRISLPVKVFSHSFWMSCFCLTNTLNNQISFFPTHLKAVSRNSKNLPKELRFIQSKIFLTTIILVTASSLKVYPGNLPIPSHSIFGIFFFLSF